MKFFIIHGSYGNPNENWFPWLKERLEQLGHTVFIPKFPTPKNQTLESWMKVFEVHQIDKETVFIGHSLGPAFILSVLEQLNCKIKACYFVAPFLGLLNNKEFDDINRTFTTKEFDWEKIKENCEKFICFGSKDDPYVPVEKINEFANKLEAKLILRGNAGHFNSSSGYIRFEELLQHVTSRAK